MDKWEADLLKATAPDTESRIIGAIGLVVDGQAGVQSLDEDASPIDPNSGISLGSAGKFITHVAALQLVDQGLIQLDDRVDKILPELAHLPIIEESSSDEKGYTLRRPSRKITLRHLLTHSSGLGDAESTSLIGKFFKSDDAERILNIAEDATPIVKLFTMPLLFEPGEGFAYGCSIYWLQLLVTRLANDTFVNVNQKNIFEPLGMTASSYKPQEASKIWESRLRMVERQDGKLIPADDASQGLMCTMKDLGTILSDLVSPHSKLLKAESLDLLFTAQLETLARESFRRQDEEYKFCCGKNGSETEGRQRVPAVDWTLAGMLAEEELPLSQMPKGTVTWEGMPNVMWAMNREKGLAMFFATQVIPVGDATANRMAVAFMRDGWRTFG